MGIIDSLKILSMTSEEYFSHFYHTNFVLYINGSGGFIGNYLNNSFLSYLINFNEDISYYILESMNCLIMV